MLCFVCMLCMGVCASYISMSSSLTRCASFLGSACGSALLLLLGVSVAFLRKAASSAN